MESISRPSGQVRSAPRRRIAVPWFG